MPSSRFAILVLLAGLLAPVAAYAASLDEQVKTAYSAWDAAFNKGDPEALAALYAEDAVLLPPSRTHDVLKGPAAIEKFFAGLFAAGVNGHKLELIEANGDDDGDMAVAAAIWSAKGKDGASLGGIATQEFTRQADGSLIGPAAHVQLNPGGSSVLVTGRDGSHGFRGRGSPAFANALPRRRWPPGEAGSPSSVGPHPPCTPMSC